MKSFNRYFTNFFYLVIFTGLLTTAFMVGCGGENNPSGPAASPDPVYDGNPIVGNIIGKVVNEDETPVKDANVKLFVQNVKTGNMIYTDKNMDTLATGEFKFSGIGSGTFVLKIEESTSFYESSKLVIINSSGTIDAGKLIVTEKTSSSSKATLDIVKGRILDPSSSLPTGFAEVSLDTGQSTVTDATGYFTLNKIASGSRKLTVFQPKGNSYKIYFEVRATSTPFANSIYFNNKTFNADKTTGHIENLILIGNEIAVFNPLSTIDPIKNATFTKNLNPKQLTTFETFLDDDLTFTWIGPGDANRVLLEFSRVYNDADVPTISKTFDITNLDKTATHTRDFKPSTLGLDFGVYEWYTKVADPNFPDKFSISKSHILKVCPSVNEMSPASSGVQLIKINNASATTLAFTVPQDSDATHTVLELYEKRGTDLIAIKTSKPDATSGNYIQYFVTYPPGGPGNGANHHWRVKYFYEDGLTMETEMAELKFVN